MMSISYRIVIIISSIFLIITVWSLIKRGLFRPAYALLWFFGSFAILLLALVSRIHPFRRSIIRCRLPAVRSFRLWHFHINHPAAQPDNLPVHIRQAEQGAGSKLRFAAVPA